MQSAVPAIEVAAEHVCATSTRRLREVPESARLERGVREALRAAVSRDEEYCSTRGAFAEV